MKENAISLNILVDSSGSMEQIASDMTGSLNQLVDDHRDLDVLVSYSIFSDEYQPIFTDKPIKEVERFHLKPDSRTALIESACKMIDEVGVRLATMPEDERPEKVMFVIITDGLENYSEPEYTRKRLFAKIKEQTEVYRWLFLYLGANQDAIQAAREYGIDSDRAVSYDFSPRGTARNYQRLSKKLFQVNETPLCGMEAIAFDAEDREE